MQVPRNPCGPRGKSQVIGIFSGAGNEGMRRSNRLHEQAIFLGETKVAGPASAGPDASSLAIRKEIATF
jgi:hypothetical protein